MMAKSESGPKVTVARLAEAVAALAERVEALEAKYPEAVQAAAKVEAKRMVRREREG